MLFVVVTAHLPWLLTFFLLGSAVGSFLNVVSRRLLRGESIAGRSHCESCHHLLSAADLTPLLSFFVFRGCCRYCGARLSWQYPLVEGGLGALFVAFSWWVFSWLGFNLYALVADLFLLAAISSLVVIFITDLFEQRIFDRVVLVGVAASFLYRLFVSEAILWDLGMALIVFLFFQSLRLLTKGRGMGDGDPPLGFLTILLTGFPYGLVTLFLPFTIGAGIWWVLVATKKKRFGEQIPFGPFLVVATFITLFWGEVFIDQYLYLLGY